MTLGQRIQELRKGQNLSQEGLGEKLGVSRQAISRWEMDGAVPEVDKLIAMGRLFGVSLNDLLQVEEGPEGPCAQVVLAPGRGWRRALAALALLLALALGMSGWQGWRVARLEERVAGLEERAAALALEGPLVADFDFATELWGDKTHVTYSFTLTAVRQVEGMTVTIQAVDWLQGVHQAELTCKGGSIYVGELTLEWPAGSQVALTALFQDGQGNYTQPLASVHGVTDGGWSADILWDALLGK